MTKVKRGGVIVKDSDGSEEHYSPEEWRHKEIMDVLNEISSKLGIPKTALTFMGKSDKDPGDQAP